MEKRGEYLRAIYVAFYGRILDLASIVLFSIYQTMSPIVSFYNQMLSGNQLLHASDHMQQQLNQTSPLQEVSQLNLLSNQQALNHQAMSIC